MNRLRFVSVFLFLLLSVSTVFSGKNIGNKPVFNRSNTILYTLDNGLTVILYQDETIPLAAVRAYVKTGSICEQKFLGYGISHYFEHVLAGGSTSKKTEDDYALWLQRIGGSYNAYTTLDHTCFHVIAGKDFVSDEIQMLSEWLRYCAFDSTQVVREKGVILKEILMDETPDNEIDRYFTYMCYPVHPIRYPVIGFKELFRTISRENLIDYYKGHYVPNNTVLVVAGNFDTNSVRKIVKRYFGDWKRKPVQPIVLPSEMPLSDERRIEKRFGETDPILYMGWQVPSAASDDVPALDILSILLGQRDDSILNVSLCEKTHLASRVDCWNDTPGFVNGIFNLKVTIVDADSMAVAEKLIMDRIDILRKKKVSRKELEKIVKELKSRMLIRLESLDAKASALGEYFIETNNPFFETSFLEKIEELSPEDIRRVARKYLDSKRKIVLYALPGESDEIHSGSNAVTDTLSESGDTKKTGVQISDFGIEERKLKGDAELVYIDRESATETIYINFRGGHCEESSSFYGITNLLLKMMGDGNGTMSHEKMSDLLNRNGILMQTVVYNDFFQLEFRFPVDELGIVKKITGSLLSNSTFSEKRFNIVKRRIIDSLKERENDPYKLSEDFFRRIIFSGYPYEVVPSGVESSLENINLEDIGQWFHRVISTERMIISASGGVDSEDLVEFAEYAAESIGKSGRGKKAGNPEMRVKPECILKPSLTGVFNGFELNENHYGFPQVDIYYGFPTVDMDDPDYYALMIVSELFGGNTSRLFKALRGENDLVYFVFGYQSETSFPRTFVIHTQTDRTNMKAVMDIVKQQLAIIRKEKIDDRTMSNLKKEILLQIPFMFETNEDAAFTIGFNVFVGRTTDYFDQLERNISKVTSDDIMKVANKYFSGGIIAVSIPDTGAGK